jgi:WD40 repeat protein/3',5'-cyclic AMP phosphodiesterase CpdA
MTKGPRPITLLHLSDLQFGRHHRFGRLGAPRQQSDQPSEESPDAAFDSLFARLQQDLRDLEDADGQRLAPDLVLLTGDLAEWGRKSEFEDVLRFTRALAALLTLPPERLVIVPGNHDINRALCRAYFDQCEGEETQPRPPYWDKWKHFAWLFRELYGLGARVEFNERTPWSLFELEDLKVVVAALNTTMAESHRDEDHHGHLGEAQLRWFEDRLTAYQQRGWLRIAALHHNVRRGPVRDDENLRDADDFTRILGGKINLVLHGHTHDGKLDWLAPAVPILSTGSAAVAQAARPEEVPDQYQMIRVHADRIEHWTRAYAPDRKRWIGDTRADPAGNAWHMTYPVAFADVSAAFPAPARQPAPAVDHDDLLPGRLDYGHARADFLARVERVCRLRARADARADIERRRIGTPAIEYLEVCTSERGMTSLYPVGAIAGEVTPESLAEFTVRVHDRYRAADPGVRSTLVYGGPPAPDPLIAQARAQRVDLRSFVEYQGLIDFRAHVRDQTRRLEDDRRYPPALYVPQRLRYRVFDEEHLAQNAITHVMAWLHEPDAQLVLVLGEFGTGKSFLLRELARRLGAGDGLVPIFIDMRDLDKGRTLDELLGQYFARYRREFSPDRFAYMLEAGRIALLFDGFDELAVRLTYPRAAEHFDAVLEAVRGSAKVVVTSRTQHFQSDQQVTALGRKVRAHASARVATLQPFDHDQIRAFLRNRFGDDQRAEERLALIDEVKDLLGLSHNPRMLSFIADLDETALRAARDAHGDITAASLYRTILDTWLAHEHERIHPRGAPPSLPVTELRAAVSALAVRMWSRSAPHLGLDDLTHDAAALVQRLAETTLDADMAAFQVGSGSLLVRDSEGRFSFLHQSVLEWLVADTAATELRTGGTSALPAAAPMSALLAQFFVDLSGREIAHRWARTALAGAGDDASTAIAKKNALIIIERAGLTDDAEPLAEAVEESISIVLAGQDLTGRDLSGQDLRGHDLAGANLSYATLVGADLSGARLTYAVLTGADLTRASLQNADLRHANVSRATLLGADLRGAEMAEAVFHRSKLVAARWDAGALDHCDTFGAALGVREHAGFITARAACRCVTWSRAGLIATAEENTVRLWDAASAREIRRLQGHTGWVTSVAFTPDGTLLASGSNDKTVRVWEVASGRELTCLRGHEEPVTSVAVAPAQTLLASASNDGTVRVWEMASGLELMSLQGHEVRIRCVAFSPDGTRLASGSNDRVVRVWGVASGRELMSLQGHEGPVTCVAFRPDGSYLASGSNDETIRLWAMADGQALRCLQGHQGWVTSVAFASDGMHLASSSDDGTVRVWSVDDGHELGCLRGHDGWVTSLAVSPEGAHLISSSTDRTVRLWDAVSNRELMRLKTYASWAMSVAFGPDGMVLASGSEDETVRVWEVASGRENMRLPGHGGAVNSVTFAPDGALLASGSSDGAIRLWRVAGDNEPVHLRGHEGKVRSVVFSPDGTLLASGSEDGTVRMWDVTSGRERSRLQEHTAWVMSVAFKPDGTVLASGSSDGALRLWDAVNGRLLRLHARPGVVTSVAFAPTGALLASGSDEGWVELWDLASGRELMRLQGHTSWVWSIAFDPGGRHLVSSSFDGTVRLWELSEGREVLCLRGHESAVTSVAFSPDGRYLATGSWDAARIWSVQTGECLAILAHLPRGWVAMTPDGRYKTGGDVAGGFWHAIGLCRFEPGELDEHIPGLRLPDDAILVPP